MVCETPDGITIQFPRHGIEVYPNESDLRSQKRNYSRGQFKLPEAAANLVSEEVADWTVAFVKIHGNIARRMVVPHDALEFRHNLDNETIGVLDLHDPKNILDRTEIDRKFDGKDVDYVVDRVLDRRQDEDGVISGYSIMGEDADEWQTSEVVEYNTTTGDFGRWVDDQIANITGIDLSMDNNGGLKLSGTLTEAMDKLADEFEADWWVGIDGTLYFGIREALGSIYEIGGVASDVVLSRYSVTEAANTVSAVKVQCPPKRIDSPEHPRYDTKLISTAATDSINGGLLVISEDKSPKTPDQLEQVAARRLIQESMDDINGSIEIDAIGTENDQLVRDLDVGDYFIVGDEVGEECREDVYTGMFVVRDVHHRSNSTTGWTIDVSVSQTIAPQNIEYKSVYYDPFHERSYDTFDDYLDEHPNVERDEPLWLLAAEGAAGEAEDGVDWVVGGTQDTADDVGDAIDNIL